MPHRDDHEAALARADALARDHARERKRAELLEAELAEARARAEAAERQLAETPGDHAIERVERAEQLAGRSDPAQGRIAFAIFVLIAVVLTALSFFGR